VRTLKGHGHWVNTLALSTEYVLRTGAHDHTGKAPKDPQEAMQVRLVCMSLAAVMFGSGSTLTGKGELRTGAHDHTGRDVKLNCAYMHTGTPASPKSTSRMPCRGCWGGCSEG
jgi:hypothetical protein